MLLPHEYMLQIVTFLHADQRSHFRLKNNFSTRKFKFNIAVIVKKMSLFSSEQKSRRLMS